MSYAPGGSLSEREMLDMSTIKILLYRFIHLCTIDRVCIKENLENAND